MRRLALGAIVASALVASAAAASALPAPGPPPGGGSPPTCPRTSSRLPFRHDRAAHRRLVPGHADVAAVCRYSGLNARRPRHLRPPRSIVGPMPARRLAHRLNLLKAFPPRPIVCPADSLREIVVRFRYAHAPDDYVAVDLTGCPAAANGPRVRSASSRHGNRLLRDLERLTERGDRVRAPNFGPSPDRGHPG
jgi:hypothetical protein